MKRRDFVRDEDGMALVLVSIMLPVLIGFALLAIDMSRANNLHYDLQRGADAFALAAAAELDGSSDAWTRAERALETLVDNQTRFSTGGTVTLASAGSPTVDPNAAACRSRGDISWCFLKSLPADDGTAIASSNRAANAGETRFIQVTVSPENFSAIFPASFLGGTNGFTVGATAVAGFRRSICEAVPMFMCNPFENIAVPGNSKTMAQAFAEGLTYSREFRILKIDSTPGPGNFGLLQTDVPLREAFAKGTTGTCYQRESVETKTGVTLGHVNSGLNVRFDIYSGSMKSHDAETAYRPATNVRKGASNSSNCNKFDEEADTSKAMGFPAGNNYSGGMTDSTWNRAGYWTLNHGGAMPSIPSSSHPTSTSQLPSRYDVYKYEISHNLVGDKAGGKNNGETGIPACYKGASGTLTNDPDRRLVTIAVVNCLANGAVNGHTTIRPDAYASVFLTNPIGKVDKSKDDDDTTANEKPIRFEIVDIEGPLGNGTLDNFLRDEAQLYR
jgi:hypothetical protein